MPHADASFSAKADPESAGPDAGAPGADPVAASEPRKPRKRGGAGRRGERKGWWILGIVVVVIAAGVGAWFWRHSAAAAAKAAARKDQVVAVKRGSVERRVESSGSIAPNLEVQIKCRASGEIVKLPYDVSDHVHQGDLLCQLDPTDEKLALRSSQAALAQAQAKLEQAKIALKEAKLNLQTSRTQARAQLDSARVQASTARAKLGRQKQLTAQKLGSREQLEAMQADNASAQYALSQAKVAVARLQQQKVDLKSKEQDVTLARAQLESQKIQLNIQQQQLDYTTVVSPMDGVVSDLAVRKGAIVASGINNVSGGTTIMTLMDLSRVFVLATVDESDIGQVRVGQAARVTVDSFPDHTFKGKVVRVAVQGVNESNVVTFQVKIEVTDKDKNLLKPEMTGNVTIIEARHDDALLVPAAAVSRRGDHYYVTTADGKRQEVSLGIQGLDHTEITKGLSVGDRVRVSPGASVASRWSGKSRGRRHHHGPM